MTDDHTEAIALHRWAVIAEAANPRLSPAERGAVVRATASRAHAHPDGAERRYSRNTLDRWIRAWRAEGLDGLRPQARADAGVVRRGPELLAEAATLRLELPTARRRPSPYGRSMPAERSPLGLVWQSRPPEPQSW